MSVFRHIQRWLGLRTDDLGSVSQACIRHHHYHAVTRGVELPTWRTPKEVAQMRRQERRAALRLAKGA